MNVQSVEGRSQSNRTASRRLLTASLLGVMLLGAASVLARPGTPAQPVIPAPTAWAASWSAVPADADRDLAPSESELAALPAAR